MAKGKGRVCRHRNLGYRKCIDGHLLECADCDMIWEWQGGPPGVLINQLVGMLTYTQNVGRHVIDIQRRMEFTGDELELVREVLAFVADYEDVGEMLADYTSRSVEDVKAVLGRHYGDRWWEREEKR